MTRKATSIFSCSRVAARLPRSGNVRSVFLAAQFFDLVEDRTENVGLVIRDRSGEIGEIFRALDDRGDALETHAGIDVPLRQAA